MQLDSLCEETNKLTKDIKDFLQEKLHKTKKGTRYMRETEPKRFFRKTTPGHHSNRVPGMSQVRRDLRETTKGEKRLRCHLRGRWQQRVRQENAPLKQESQSPEQTNLGMGWPHGQYMYGPHGHKYARWV